jgi:4-alpha-glucanotransferase
MSNPLFPRSAGLLLHPTSLPGPHGMGDLGGVPALLDWMASAGLSVWQVLPLVPPGAAHSPYASPSALSGNTWLIALSGLVADQLLTAAEIAAPPMPQDVADFAAAQAFKAPLLRLAADRLRQVVPQVRKHPLRQEFVKYYNEQTWAVDAGLFHAIREAQGHTPWWEWPEPLRTRDKQALLEAEEALSDDVQRYVALQFLFDRQWRWVRGHARHRKLRIVGDVPIYVDGDSVDTWCQPRLFQLDAKGRAKKVAGVPPDYFAETGQFWGNPLYDWAAMARDRYRWWASRLRRMLVHVDAVRIDHFRGFSAYWAIPREAPNATYGSWQRGPGLPLFTALRRELGELPLIAEDLGDIDEAAATLRIKAALPGMKVLQFAFGDGAHSPFLPHHHEPDGVVYTGTHDNDTTVGWWLASPDQQALVQRYLGPLDAQTIAWRMVEAAFASVAHTAIVPAQDLLGLGSEARMNRPGVTDGNWAWRLQSGALDADLAARVRELSTTYDRLR